MRRMSIDFNKVNHRNYRVYRIMCTSPIWAEIYRHRIKELSSFRSAIIFPEMVLGLNQTCVYFVQAFSSQHVAFGLNISEIMVSNFYIMDGTLAGEPSISLITKLEEETLHEDDLDKLYFKIGYTRHQFATSMLFTNKRDAAKYSVRILQSKFGANNG